LDFIWLPSLRSGRAAGTIIGSENQAAAGVACELDVTCTTVRVQPAAAMLIAAAAARAAAWAVARFVRA